MSCVIIPCATIVLVRGLSLISVKTFSSIQIRSYRLLLLVLCCEMSAVREFWVSDAEGFEFRKRFLANILEARTPLLLARLLLVMVDAIRPAVAERIFTKEWTFMDVDLCPGGFAILDPVRNLLQDLCI